MSVLLKYSLRSTVLLCASGIQLNLYAVDAVDAVNEQNQDEDEDNLKWFGFSVFDVETADRGLIVPSTSIASLLL